MQKYPELIIDKGKLAENIREVTARCSARGISVAGVIKGMNGLPELIRVYAESNVVMIGSSRIEQIQDAVEIGNADPSLKKPTMMIRIPMLSEVPEIVRYCDYSLESEDATLRALNEEVFRQAAEYDNTEVLPQAGMPDGANLKSACQQMPNDGSLNPACRDVELSMSNDYKQKRPRCHPNPAQLVPMKRHKVILMAEMGDLREGYVGDDLVRAALMVENDLPGLELAGVGMNVGCYGSILPTREKLDEFVSRAEEVEKAIGRRLDIISGGATSSLMRLIDGNIPERINNLRVGEGILLAHDLPLFYGCDLSFLHQDVFRLRMEVVELKKKPTYPQGEIGRDAFGHLPEYIDRGERMHAICACGKVDYGSEEDIFPLDPRIKVIGASSDHTLLDVEEMFAAADAEAAAGPGSAEGEPLKVGDILDFAINYASMVFVTASRNIHIIYK